MKQIFILVSLICGLKDSSAYQSGATSNECGSMTPSASQHGFSEPLSTNPYHISISNTTYLDEDLTGKGF